MAVHVRVGMPLSDFVAETNEQLFELINGERIAKFPSVAVHNEVLHDKISAIDEKVAAYLADGDGIIPGFRAVLSELFV